jgi:hypothetical protein
VFVGGVPVAAVSVFAAAGGSFIDSARGVVSTTGGLGLLSATLTGSVWELCSSRRRTKITRASAIVAPTPGKNQRGQALVADCGALASIGCAGSIAGAAEIWGAMATAAGIATGFSGAGDGVRLRLPKPLGNISLGSTSPGGVALGGGSFHAVAFGAATALPTVAARLDGVVDTGVADGGVLLGFGGTNVEAESSAGVAPAEVDAASPGVHPAGASTITMLPHLGHARICPMASGLVTRKLRLQVVH